MCVTFEMQSIMEFATAFSFWLVNQTMRCTRMCAYSVYALVKSGSCRLHTVAAWNGPPRAGKPEVGQLCIVKLMACNGVLFEYLSRGGMGKDDVAQVIAQVDRGCTHVLYATLSTTVSGAGDTSHVDVSKLCYHVPPGVSFTACELSLLVNGMSYWNRMDSSTLKVATIDCTYCFNNDDLVDALILAPGGAA